MAAIVAEAFYQEISLGLKPVPCCKKFRRSFKVLVPPG
jgi:hypothetical protein